MEAMERMMAAEEYAYVYNVRYHIVNKYTVQCADKVGRTYCDVVSAALVILE
jgi:hypothetical protein